MINRYITESILESLVPGRVTALFGARRTGKTTLINSIAERLSEKRVLKLNGEDLTVAEILASGRQEILENLTKGYDYVIIDEAQSISGIGKNLKLLIDTRPDLSILATGSASFDLRNQIGEPLTGRSVFFMLYPFAYGELGLDYLQSQKSLSEMLIFGAYPQVFLSTTTKEKRLLLENIKNGYLLKDILILDNLKDSLFVMNLLRLVAFQIGNEVSFNELAGQLGTTVKTVQRYLEILEKTFVLFRLNGFSRNHRKEITKSPRYYFWDNGIRNVIINNFSPLEQRDDAGKLWENYCVAERVKKQVYRQTFSDFYFWRTYDQQEIDLIEITDGKMSAFEFKWGVKKVRIPKAFQDHYSDADFQVINRENFIDFLQLAD
ncbi:MAG: ATP-binding protein [Bacteroidetes bacterium]|nr:ATP-binding protein [Bacteroidota bacterium]